MEYVYFISDGEGCKIGFSKCPEQRLKELQTANKNKLTLLYKHEVKFGRKTETAMHHFLSSKKQNGEWFLLEDVDINNAKQLCTTIEKNLE